MHDSCAVAFQLGRGEFLSKLCMGGAALLSLNGCELRPTGRWRVGLSSPHETEILNEFYEDMKREALPVGNVDLIIVDAAKDPVKQFTNIEAFIAQKFDGVFFLVPSSEGMDEIVSRAAAKGIFMFNHSASPVTACTQNVVLDQYSAGYKVGEYAARWNNEGVGPSEPKVPQGDPERSAGLLQTRTGLLALGWAGRSAMLGPP